MTFFEAWCFLEGHPKFNHLKNGKPDVIPGFMDNLDVIVIKVDKVTGDYSDAADAIAWVQLEAGPWSTIPIECFGSDYVAGTYDEIRSHDTRLDCNAETYELAIIKMAALVLKYYGNYEA